MKRNWFKFICCMMIVALLAGQVSALASNAYILKVNGIGSYVRSESGKYIGSLRNGTRVLYWGHRKDHMLEVMTADGKVGYVYQGNLNTYGAMNTKQLYRTDSAANLYKRSGSKMKKIGRVGKNVPVIVYQRVNGWALVKSLTGKSAYIKTSALKKVS